MSHAIPLFRVGLNPFEFRAGLKRLAGIPLKETNGLNPFEFRAGLKRMRIGQSAAKHRLNPFEFRAGLKLLEFANEELVSGS